MKIWQQFARKYDNNTIFFPHSVGLYKFLCYSWDEAIQPSNVSWSLVHKIKMFLTIEWFLNLIFFTCMRLGICFLGLQKFDQGILGIHCLVILLSPFRKTHKCHPNKFLVPLIFASKSFKQIFLYILPINFLLKIN